jgi:hypothetical protein
MTQRELLAWVVPESPLVEVVQQQQQQMVVVQAPGCSQSYSEQAV